MASAASPQAELCELPPNQEPHQQQQQLQLQQLQRQPRPSIPFYNSPQIPKVKHVYNPLKRQQQKWTYYYQRLQSFRSKYKHTHVPKCYPPDPKLANWVWNQKRYVQAWEAGLPSPLTLERIEALRQVDFFTECPSDWKTELMKSKTATTCTKRLIEVECGRTWITAWYSHYQTLAAFYRRHGHVNVPFTPSNEHLTDWIRKQRRSYRRFEAGKSSSMTQERISALEQLSFVWEPLNINFDLRLTQLKHYQRQFGNCRVPRIHPPNRGLGRWVAYMRRQYRLRQKGRPSSLNPERIQLLEDVGMEWRSKRQDEALGIWNIQFQKLVKYKQSNGHGNVPKGYRRDKGLGTWVRNQRAQYWLWKRGKRSPMTEQRERLLQGIGFEWKLR